MLFYIYHLTIQYNLKPFEDLAVFRHIIDTTGIAVNISFTFILLESLKGPRVPFFRFNFGSKDVTGLKFFTIQFDIITSHECKGF